MGLNLAGLFSRTRELVFHLQSNWSTAFHLHFKQIATVTMVITGNSGLLTPSVPVTVCHLFIITPSGFVPSLEVFSCVALFSSRTHKDINPWSLKDHLSNRRADSENLSNLV